MRTFNVNSGNICYYNSCIQIIMQDEPCYIIMMATLTLHVTLYISMQHIYTVNRQEMLFPLKSSEGMGLDEQICRPYRLSYIVLPSKTFPDLFYHSMRIYACYELQYKLIYLSFCMASEVKYLQQLIYIYKQKSYHVYQ